MKKLLRVLTFILRGLLYFLVLAFLCLAGYFGWHRYGKFYVNSETRSFYKLVNDSKQEYLDLRKFNALDWDELVYWSPYQNICNYGIDGFKAGSANCKFSEDDGECYLLFLKNNKLVRKIPILRSKIDFDDELNRVPKNRAIFMYTSKGSFPKLKLKK
jgi:hypothetical protein